MRPPRTSRRRNSRLGWPFAFVPWHNLSAILEIPASIQIARFSRSRRVSRRGFNVPILVDSRGGVIAGHGRLAACRLLGWTEVPTITLDHLSALQIQAFMIADNRLTDTSTWDDELLAQQLKLLASADLNFDLEAIGFDLPAIDLRIQGLETGELDSPEPETVEVPGAASLPVSKLGDLWQLGAHRILCGNALEAQSYQRLMEAAAAQVVFSDAPYNVPIAGHVGGKGAIKHREFSMATGEMDAAQFTAFLTQACRLMADHSVDGALHYLCMDWRHLTEILAAGRAVYAELKNCCVWTKDNPGMGSLYRSQYELVLVFKRGTGTHINNIRLGQYGRNRSNVWTYPGVNSFSRSTEEGNLLALHPTVKPTALVADVLMDATHRGDAVLDPFLGSGTTVMAAEKTGRVAFGMEIDPLYVDTAIRRWQRATGRAALHADGRCSFDDREREVAASAAAAVAKTAL